MKIVHLLTLVIVALVLNSCSLIEQILGRRDRDNPLPKETEEQEKPIVKVASKAYQVSRTLDWNLLNTDLDLKVDWVNHQLLGTARLKLKPYGIKKVKSLVLDAKGMQIKSVNSVPKVIRKYEYEAHQWLRIELDSTMDSSQTLDLKVEYIACPDSLEAYGISTNSDQKGLYFIDAEGTDPTKPTQLWTQGETEYNSTWFPTLDQPNVRTRQSIKITVDTPYTALSNGRLVYMLLNRDGSRTFYWKQEKPHAPYLFMLGVGEFSIVEDYWRDSIPVNYYVDPPYESFARLVFGKTPEMMEFFSGVFGVDYPWDKYDQMVVHDFVSGAMENTGAVLLMSALHRDSIAYNDATYEEYVAHELAHQWFGNLVTCKSWANLTLNEAFASYAEYLWEEYQSGKEEATEVLMGFRNKYFGRSTYSAHPLREHHFHHPDDMFDAHSYDKGALVLHLLREELGDEIWRDGIRHYLIDNAYQSVDIAHLQHAMEKASGRQLDQFFDQWFRQKGHPVLQVNYQYIDSLNQLKVDVAQNKDNIWPLFRIQPKLSWWANGQEEWLRLSLDSTEQTFYIDMASSPRWVQLDALMEFPCEIVESKPEDWWLSQVSERDYRTRLRAWMHFEENPPFDQNTIKALVSAFNSQQSLGRSEVQSMIEILKNDFQVYGRTYPEAKSKLLGLQKYTQLAAAIPLLSKGYNLTFNDLARTYLEPSYVLKVACLKQMANLDYAKTRPYLKESIKSASLSETATVARIVAGAGNAADLDLILTAVEQSRWNTIWLIEFFENAEWSVVENEIEKLNIIKELSLTKSQSQPVIYQLDSLKRSLESKYLDKGENLGSILAIIDQIQSEMNQ